MIRSNPRTKAKPPCIPTPASTSTKYQLCITYKEQRGRVVRALVKEDEKGAKLQAEILQLQDDVRLLRLAIPTVVHTCLIQPGFGLIRLEPEAEVALRDVALLRHSIERAAINEDLQTTKIERNIASLSLGRFPKRVRSALDAVNLPLHSQPNLPVKAEDPTAMEMGEIYEEDSPVLRAGPSSDPTTNIAISSVAIGEPQGKGTVAAAQSSATISCHLSAMLLQKLDVQWPEAEQPVNLAAAEAEFLSPEGDADTIGRPHQDQPSMLDRNSNTVKPLNLLDAATSAEQDRHCSTQGVLRAARAELVAAHSSIQALEATLAAERQTYENFEQTMVLELVRLKAANIGERTKRERAEAPLEAEKRKRSRAEVALKDVWGAYARAVEEGDQSNGPTKEVAGSEPANTGSLADNRKRGLQEVVQEGQLKRLRMEDS